MAMRRKNFQMIRTEDCALFIDYLSSKTNRAATLQELKYLCRRRGMSGMAETIIDWLEQTGTVRYERSIEAIYLNRPEPAPAAPVEAAE